MADERYTYARLPDPDTEVDLEPPVMVGVRYVPHRIEQTLPTLSFPRYFDDEFVLPNVFFTR
jgi:hypothetical protein